MFLCSHRRKGDEACYATVTRSLRPEESYTRNSCDHHHPANRQHTFRREVYSLARAEAARNHDVSTAEVRNGVLRAAYPDEDQRTWVPRFRNIDKAIQQQRQRTRPAEPDHVQSPLDMAWLAQACPNLQVVMDRSGADGSRVVGFSTAYHLSQLGSMGTWFVDGTFKSRPAIFKSASSQVFTIHGFVGGPDGRKQFPMVYALMTNRRAQDYVHLFEGLRRAMDRAGLPCQPVSWMLDFEAAIWRAIRTCFPQSTPSGCGFHWTKCINNKWRDLGLHNSARTAEDLKVLYARVQAMRFLPHNYILQAFDNLLNTVNHYPAAHAVHSFLEYLGETWVHSNLFSPDTWSQFGLELKTNNDLEGYHTGLNRIMGPRPAFYAFVERMFVQLGNSRMQIQSGDLNRRECQQTADKHRAIEALMQQYVDRRIDLWPVLDGIATLFDYRRGACH